MDTLAVRRLAARYRVPAGRASERTRLDRVLRGVLDEALEPALAAAGVPAHEEVCVRSVHAPARLSLDGGDATLAAAWSAALAGAIRATLDAGGANVVRYGSRSHALVDLLAGVAAGDFARAWAWRQLGLWTASDAPASPAAADEAVRALVSSPELAAASLAAAARLGALPGLARRIPPDGWAAIARAALRAAAVPGFTAVALAGWAVSSASPASAGDASPDALLPESVARAVDRIVRASAIARALSRSAATSAEARRPLAILAALEADASALSRGAGAALGIVAAVDREIAESASVASAGRTSTDDDRANDPHRPKDPHPPKKQADARRHERMTADRRDSVDEDRSTDETIARRAERMAEDAGGDDPRIDDDRRIDIGPMKRVGDETEAAEDERPVPEVRAGAETRWGGLLFLIHVVDRAGLPAEAAESDALAGRPLRWVLHRLAVELLGLDERDPAALAFAGVGPDRDPPTRGEAAATEEEAEEIARMARRVEAAAHEVVRREPAPDARAAAALLRDLSRRRATIEAFPGWIDVRLSLDEVSVEVRRAGLDLDPGWVSWLGVVVRFVYG